MRNSKTLISRLLQACRYFFIFAVIIVSTAKAQIGLHVPPPKQSVRLFDEKSPGIGHFVSDSLLFPLKTPGLKRSVEMDSSANYLSASESLEGTEFYLPSVVDLETYVQMRLAFDRRQLWRKSFVDKVVTQQESSGGALRLDIPIRIRNKTFTRIFGSDRVGLRVTGNISFDLSGRSEDRSGAAVNASQNQNSFSPRFNQTQQFTIEGKIGEKVTVSVEQNSEAQFDFENTLKIKYDGDDDEIIQSIEAGNIGLSLPSTKYVIFGGSNQGLFGIKSQIQVGDFYFTGLASLERGEQQKLTINGNSSESKVTIHDYNFIENKYFFIDTYYKDQYEKGFTDDLSNWVAFENRLIRNIDVWVSVRNDWPQKRDGLAVLNPADPIYQGLTVSQARNFSAEGGKVEPAVFRRLEEQKDYTIDYDRGILSLRQTLQDHEILGVAFSTDQGQFGTLSENLQDDSTAVILRLVKPKNLKPDYTETWPLMMRNVYSLGGTNIEKEGFDLRIEFNVTGQHETRQLVEPKKTFLHLMGLDIKDENGTVSEDGDKIIDENGYLVNRPEGLLMFPSLQPFHPLPDSRFQIDSSNYVKIYNLNNQQDRVEQTKFDLVVTSRSTKSSFDLGFNILEGSEEVYLNGSKLKRDKDYIIDYFSGNLTLTSDEARRSSSNVEIKYEKATIFQLDKKTIIGGHGEYRFWEDSFVGFTALYLNKSTLDQRVRVGQEPFENLVWDINAALKFKPRFLTKWADALPLVETNEPSSLDIEAEFAQVLPNPNTLDNNNTGDKNGVAYIDDFEGSKRTTTLGIRYLTWTAASAPAVLPNISPTTVEDTVVDKSRGRMIWYNPFNQVLIKDIWPNRDVNSQTGQTTDVLALEFWREHGSNPDSSWAGIMRSTSTFANQQKTKFIEMWVKGTGGTINIDIGQISEDWYMKGQDGYGRPGYHGLNTEDGNLNGVLDDNEDTGIDGYANGNQGDDPFDNWRQPDRRTGNYDGINGTEGNSRAQGTRYPDTEDLDGDGQLNLLNDYFEYSFSLDENDPKAQEWISGSTSKGWRQFRIPLKEFDRIVGNPDTTFQQIYFTRLWVSDLDTTRQTIFLATFDFVGNEWEEKGIAATDTSSLVLNDSLFNITVYNSEENVVSIANGPEAYHSPPGVAGIRDRITKALSKEQSLVLRMKELQPGAHVEARKNLYGEAQSLVNYKKLRMFIHGDQKLPSDPSTDTSYVSFFIRFGSDANNYYEFGQDVYAHWYSGNKMDIDLDELSRTKFSEDKFNLLSERLNSYYKVTGNPSLKTIRYYIVGVKNKDPLTPFNGELWLDEMRVSEVRRESGTALRLRTSLKMADLLTFNGEWESKDADFHDIKTQFGSGNTNEIQNYSGKINLDKFLPDDWNVSLPVDARASFNKSIPKYFPKTDVLTHYQNNTFEKKIKSLFGLRKLDPELENEVSYNQTYGLGTTIQKRGRSEAWYLKYTIDHIKFDFDWSYKKMRNYETQFNVQEQFKETVSYNVPFGQNNYWEPFKSFSKTPVLSELSTQKLYYTPGNVNMNLSITDVKKRSKLRNDDLITRNVNTTSIRSLQIGYTVLPSLKLTYQRKHSADADFVGLNGKELIKSIITKGNFGLDTDIGQNFTVNYKPKFFRWLTSDYSFDAASRYYYSDVAKNQKQSSLKTTRRASFSFSPSQLAAMIYKPANTKKAPTRRNTRRSRNRRATQDQDKNKDKQEDGQKKDGDKKEQPKKEKQPIKFPNPLLWIYAFFDSWQNIQTTYSWTQNVNNSYMSRIPTWQYQFGFTNDPGVPQDTSFSNLLVGPAVTDQKSLRNAMNFTISKNIKMTLNHEYSVSETHNDRTQSGNESSTFLAWGDDPSKNFSGLKSDIRSLIPDWTIKINGLENFLFFKQLAKTVSLEHSRSGKFSETKKLSKGSLVPATQEFRHNFQPLVGVNISWQGGISTNIRLTKSSTYNFNATGGATRSETSSFTVSASYATSGGFRIPIPIWPFKGKTFKNEMNFTLTFDKSSNTTFQKNFTQTSFQESQSNSSWKLRPSATYRFNTRVSGSLFYEMGQTENKISGKYSYNEFGITVNIAIRD